jgi:hypothetical protein
MQPAMPRLRLYAAVLMGLLGASAAGCAGTSNTTDTTRTYSYEADLYRVEIEERRREDGTCLRRRILFTADKDTRKRHLDQVRALDRTCNAMSVRGFDSFEIVRSPGQQEQYTRIARFRRRVNARLWADYQAALRAEERRTDGS